MVTFYEAQIVRTLLYLIILSFFKSGHSSFQSLDFGP